MVGGVEREGVDAHEVESAVVPVPVLGGVWFLVVPALEVVGQAQPDLEVEMGTLERKLSKTECVTVSLARCG